MEPLNDQEAARAFARMWNDLDVRHLEPLLSENVVYESQSILTPLEGRQAVTDYLAGKIETLKRAGETARVFAELGETQSYPMAPGIGGRPCVLVAQGERDNVLALVLFTLEVGGIRRIDLCTVAPHPSTARRTGEYPR